MSKCELPLKTAIGGIPRYGSLSLFLSRLQRFTTETNKMQVALKQRGIDKLLEEAREDNKENDAIHLGRK